MSLMQLRRLVLPLLAGLSLAAPTWAQTKPRIEKAADLPRFTYKVDGTVEDLCDKYASYGLSFDNWVLK